MKHILVVRKDAASPSFFRVDRFGTQWVKHRLDGQTLRAIVPSIISDIKDEGGATSVTMSSCRNAESFPDPDNANIPEGVNVIVLAPVDPPSSSAELNGIRMWNSLHWSGPSKGPTLGDRMRQKTVAEWIERFFTDEQYDTWARKGVARIELWVRPFWDARQMFPELWAKPKLVDDLAPVAEEAPKPKAIEGEVEVKAHISFAPRTMWRVFGADGREMQRGIKTKDEAQAILDRYLAGETV